MSRSLHRAALALAISIAGGCDYSVWLSDDLDGGLALDAPIDAPIDAPPTDTGPIDAPDAHVIRECETTPSILGAVRATVPLEQPTFAVSGRVESLRYGVLVPPSASATATADTTLLLADRVGTALGTRAIRVEDASGPSSTATLHALSPEGTAEGFLVLGPRALWILDAAGAGDPIALATPPRPEWQRSAGWIDADRFVFATDTNVLAVFDRTAGVVTTTSISVAGAGAIHVEPGGVTVSMAGAPSETIVYAPDLSGAEILRTAWDDGAPLGERLIAAVTTPSGRMWIVRSANEFRTDISSFRVPATGDPERSAQVPPPNLAPITASTEGAVVAIQASGPLLMLYSLELDSFRSLPSPSGPALVEWLRDDEHVSVLTLAPGPTGDISLELSCGLR